MRYLIIISFCTYVQLLTSIHLAQDGAARTVRMHIVEWGSFCLALLLALVSATTSYMSTILPAPCLGGWPFGHQSCSDSAPLILTTFLFEMLPRCALVFFGQFILTRIVLNVRSRLART